MSDAALETAADRMTQGAAAGVSDGAAMYRLAAALGIIGGTQPQGYTKREEVALMCKRAVAAAVKATREPGP